MNISTTIRPTNLSQTRPATKAPAASSPEAPAEAPQESFTPSIGVKRIAGEAAPYLLAGLGVASGVAAAVVGGGWGLAAGAVGVGAAGAAVGTLLGGLSGMGPADQQISPLAGAAIFGTIGAALGTGAAALPGVVGGVVGGLVVGGVASTVGFMGGRILQAHARGEM